LTASSGAADARDPVVAPTSAAVAAHSANLVEEVINVSLLVRMGCGHLIYIVE
jgi:hypothetical protein